MPSKTDYETDWKDYFDPITGKQKKTDLRFRSYKDNVRLNPCLDWFELARNIRLFVGDMKAGIVPDIPEVKMALDRRMPPRLNPRDKDRYMRMMGFEPLPLLKFRPAYSLSQILAYSLKHYGPLHVQMGKPDELIFTPLLGIECWSIIHAFVNLGGRIFPPHIRGPKPMTKDFDKAICHTHQNLSYFYSPVYYFRGKNYSATELFRRRIYG